MKYLLIVFLLFGCQLQPNEKDAKKVSKSTFMTRFENEEVICYINTRWDTQMECRWKTKLIGKKIKENEND